MDLFTIIKQKKNHYYFHIAGLLKGRNQPVDQVNVAALLTYGQKFTTNMYVPYCVSDH